LEKEFEQIEHTADVGINARGDTLEQLFANCLKGMLSILTEKKISSDQTKEIKLAAPDRESLLVDFLNEVLFLANTRSWLPVDAEIEVKDNILKAKLKGSAVDLRETLREEIKAATHHRLEIFKEKGTWLTRVYFDV
jgi:SHS2 domain-containing protein